MKPDRSWLYAGAIVVATVAVYAGISRHGFISFDDPLYVTENPQVRAGITWQGLLWALRSTRAATNWHPLTWVSHMLDCQWFGLDPGAHHLHSLVLHVLNALLLFALLARLTGAAGRSAFAALLFAVHPLRVESVAWISERKDLLSAFYFLLALHAYAWTMAPRRVRPEGTRWIAGFVIVAACFVLGLMSKPMVVTLPVVLLIMDVWPLERLRVTGESGIASVSAGLARLVAEKLPLFGIAAAAAAVTLLIRPTGAIPTLEQIPLGLRFANALIGYGWYLWKAVWPTGLGLLYPLPEAVRWGELAASVGTLALISAFAIRQRATRPYLIFGWGWYLVTLFPVIGVVQTGSQATADRYSYLPLIGPFVIAAWGLHDLAVRAGVPERARTVAAAAVVAAFATAAWRQAGYWNDSEALYRRTLAVTDRNFIIHTALGSVLGREGRSEEAEAHFREAIRIQPAYALAHFDLGSSLLHAGRTDEATAEFREAIRVDPDYGEARVNLAFVRARAGDTAGAIEQDRAALRANPDYPLALNNLAWLLATSEEDRLRDGREAVRLAERACALTEGRSGRFLATLGAAYAEAGRFQEAARAAEQALALSGEAGPERDQVAYRQQILLYRSGRTLRASGAPSRAASRTGDDRP